MTPPPPRRARPGRGPPAEPAVPGEAPAPPAPAGAGPSFRVRPLEGRDIPTVAAFEAEIATIAFPDDPVTDLGFHARKLEAALGDPRAAALVAEDQDGLVGWAWVVERENFVTKERYGDFRSLYVVGSRRGTGVAFALMRACLEFGARRGLGRLVGRTGATNQAMQALYRMYGFAPKHVVFERALGPGPTHGAAPARDPTDRPDPAGRAPRGREDGGRSSPRRRGSRRP